jgi:hypothetical protein
MLVARVRPSPQQVLFGSYPIARCRDPYAVVTYLTERIYPRLHVALHLRKAAHGDGSSGGQQQGAAHLATERGTVVGCCTHGAAPAPTPLPFRSVIQVA